MRGTSSKAAFGLIVMLASSLVVAPRTALAQSAGPVQRADLTAAVGTFSSRHPQGEPYDRWGTSALATLAAGYYWTDHVKSEVEIGWTGDRHVYGSEPAGGPLPPYIRIYQEHIYRSTLVSVAQAWQGGSNAWFHPFVSAGIALDREQHVRERPSQIVATGTEISAPARQIPALTVTETTVRARPFADVGFKVYATPRGFFRTDLTLGFNAGVRHARWTAGGGLDF